MDLPSAIADCRLPIADYKTANRLRQAAMDDAHFRARANTVRAMAFQEKRSSRSSRHTSTVPGRPAARSWQYAASSERASQGSKKKTPGPANSWSELWKLLRM